MKESHQDKKNKKEKKDERKKKVKINYNKIQVNKKDELGRGGYGIVYKGKWEGQDVAIKELYLKNMTEASQPEYSTRQLCRWPGLRNCVISTGFSRLQPGTSFRRQAQLLTNLLQWLSYSARCL